MRRKGGPASLDWLVQEGGGDAAAVRDRLQALAGPPAPGESVERVPHGSIDPSLYQARRVFHRSSLEALAESVRRNGLLQPVVLRLRPGGRYELVAGERRWRVVGELGWETVPAVLREVDDLTAHVLGQVENDAREDVSAWERALGWARLRDHAARELGAVPSLSELGRMRGGADKSTVSRYLAVGDAFPPEAVARAGIAEEEIATLALQTLVRAARKLEGQRFAVLRDVLRKRRARAVRRPAGDPGVAGEAEDVAADPAGGEVAAARVPEAAEPGGRGWEHFYHRRSIRVETSLPAGELSQAQARAAAQRMVPALAALAARAGGEHRPVSMLLEGEGGRVLFVPGALDEAGRRMAREMWTRLGEE